MIEVVKCRFSAELGARNLKDSKCTTRTASDRSEILCAPQVKLYRHRTKFHVKGEIVRPSARRIENA